MFFHTVVLSLLLAKENYKLDLELLFFVMSSQTFEIVSENDKAAGTDLMNALIFDFNIPWQTKGEFQLSHLEACLIHGDTHCRMIYSKHSTLKRKRSSSRK